jgi:hypothetical protein
MKWSSSSDWQARKHVVTVSVHFVQHPIEINFDRAVCVQVTRSSSSHIDEADAIQQL